MIATQGPASSRHATTIAVTLIVLAALSRLLPHPPNFTPIEAIGLFGGAVMLHKRMAFLVTLGAYLLSDAIIGFHALSLLVAACLVFNVWLGSRLQKNLTGPRLLGSGLVAASLFFVATNLGVWLTSGMYAIDTAGLISCFTMAIPFFAGTIGGMLFYSLLMFVAFDLATRFTQKNLTTA
jgi:hypothetical protein